MRKIIFVIALFFPSLCYSAYKTDALNVTSSSITINGISYIWPSDSGTAGQCLSTDGGNPLTLSWVDCSGSPTPTVYNYALLEDSTYILLEDSSKMLLEH